MPNHAGAIIEVFTGRTTARSERATGEVLNPIKASRGIPFAPPHLVESRVVGE